MNDPDIDLISPEPLSVIGTNPIFKVIFKNHLDITDKTLVLGLITKWGTPILTLSTHQIENGVHVFMIKPKYQLLDKSIVQFVIKFDKFVIKDDASFSKRRPLILVYTINNELANKSKEAIIAEPKRSRPVMMMGSSSNPPLFKPHQAKKQRLADTSSSGLKSLWKKPTSYTDYERYESTILSLLNLQSVPASRSSIRLFIITFLNDIDKITPLIIESPITLTKIRKKILDIQSLQLEGDEERIKRFILVTGSDEWHVHMEITNDAEAAALQNNDFLKVDISNEKSFFVAKELDIEERLLLRFEEAKERGDVLEIDNDDNEDDEEDNLDISIDSSLEDFSSEKPIKNEIL